MNCLSSISPLELTLLGILVGLIAIAELNTDELNVVGNWLIGVGGIMIIAASQGGYLSSLQQGRFKEDMLRKQMDLLRQEVMSISGKQNTCDMKYK